MTPERWQQVREIFSSASELEAAARACHLDEACGEDADLRREVESLLAIHRTPDAIVDRFAGDYLSEGGVGVPEDRWLGQRVGPYELVALLGRGGMGEVYRARRADAHYEKEVAIKLVRGGYSTDFVLQRFRAERQILASLDHPNIARLLDGGATPEGVPYLVMELVEGRPIDAYCEEHALPIAERLRLFQQVCAAVAYAHRHLIVHRDLKPRNILVAADGSIKLLDFGIAKILQDPGESASHATMTAISALTPAFSSPEQILGLPITTASDVYSLGVVLFHLLSGRSPYRGSLASTQDAITQVCEKEPLRPSAAAAGLARDLDDIVLMALRKEPEKRYASVERLSEDIRRYLTGLPVAAHGGRMGYRAAKFARRHRVEIAAALVVALALIGGVIAATHQAHIAQREKLRAERDFSRTRKLANSLMFELHDAIKDLRGATPARQLLVTRALEYLNELAAEISNDDEINKELAVAYRKVGDIQGGYGTQNAGDFRVAVMSYQKSAAMLGFLVAKRPADLEERAELSRSLRSLALGEFYAGHVQASVPVAGLAAESIAEALEAEPENLRYRQDMQDADAAYCSLLGAAGDFHESLPVCRKSIAEAETLLQGEPRDLRRRRALAVAYDRAMNAIVDYVSQADGDAALLPEAVAIERKALELDANLSAEHPDDERAKRDLVADHANLAKALFFVHQVPAAIDECIMAIGLLDTVIAADPENVAARLSSAQLRRNLGHAYLSLGKSAAAFDAYNAALGILGRLPAGQSGEIGENEYAAAVLGLARAHVLVASDAHISKTRKLKEWLKAESAFEKSAALHESLRARGALNASQSKDLRDSAAGVATSKAAIRRLGGAPVSRTGGAIS